MHEIELVAGTDPAEYERRWLAGDAFESLPGWRSYLLKGEQGPRVGKFATVLEIDSVEARDRFFPREHAMSDDLERWLAEHPGAQEWMQAVNELEASDVATDYLVVGDLGVPRETPGVLAIHDIELVEGADTGQFERRFVGSEAQTPVPGVRTHLLLGERGARVGRYAMLTEIDSLALRDQYFPQVDPEPTVFDRWMDDHPELRTAVEATWELIASQVTTDYVFVGE